MSDFEEVQVCPHCGELAEERRISEDEGLTFCSDECGCIEGDERAVKYECPKCHELKDEPKCDCK